MVKVGAGCEEKGAWQRVKAPGLSPDPHTLCPALSTPLSPDPWTLAQRRVDLRVACHWTSGGPEGNGVWSCFGFEAWMEDRMNEGEKQELFTGGADVWIALSSRGGESGWEPLVTLIHYLRHSCSSRRSVLCQLTNCSTEQAVKL